MYGDVHDAVRGAVMNPFNLDASRTAMGNLKRVCTKLEQRIYSLTSLLRMLALIKRR